MRGVKQEVEGGQASGGAGAMVAVQVAAPVADLEVRIEKAIVGSVKVLCPYDVYGCRTYVIYHEVGDHQCECSCAPCRCLEPGCAFVGSPPMLRDHLKDTHAWPVDKITYGRAHNIRLPETCPPRLLQAEDDGRVFFVAVGAHGARLSVTMACVRASAAAGPRYSCKLWATGNPGAETGRVEIAMAEADVPSSRSVPGPGTPAAAEAAPLSVRRSMLHGTSMEMMLSIKAG